MGSIKKNKIYADLIVDFLVDEKITHVFDLAGGMIAFLEDAISRKKGIECVPAHHEQASGFAAEGYSRVGGNFGVAIATSGPGATNMITPIGSCFFDSVPVLFITGQVHTNNIKKNNKIRQEGFQETDIVSIVKTITKYSVRVESADQVIYELEKAHFIMKQGRLGPVLVDIPINIQRTEVDKDKVKHFYGSREHLLMKKHNNLFDSENKIKVKKLQKFLNESKSPIILAGHGIRLSDSIKDLRSFVDRNDIPVVSSLMGIDVYQDKDKYIGYIGSNGNRDANIILANSDLIIALGSRLDVRQIGDSSFFNKNGKLVHVDIDESVINYSVKSSLNFRMDLKQFFELTKNVNTKTKPRWFDFIRKVQNNFKRSDSNTKKVNPNLFLKRLSELSSSNSVVSVDVGQNQQWCAQSWKVKEGQRILFSGGMGSMGFALPAGIGSWFASSNSNSLVISGDGGIQMNIQELETISRNKIPMKIFVMNNKSLGMVREFQDLYLKKNHQSTVKGYGNPDFKKLSEAYNIDYNFISDLDDMDSNFVKILKNKKPVLFEVDVSPNATLLPRVVYGHALDDQVPYLSKKQKEYLEKFKKDLFI